MLTWEVSVTMDDDFCVDAMKSALRRYKTPGIFNTDYGAQYTSNAFTGALKDHGSKSAWTVTGFAWITSSYNYFGRQ